MNTYPRTFIALAFSAGFPLAALASSDDAWEEFRADVSAKCLEAAADYIENPVATVDPFGSEKFGLALVSGKPVGADGKIVHICVYDKQTQAVELGVEELDPLLK